MHALIYVGRERRFGAGLTVLMEKRFPFPSTSGDLFAHRVLREANSMQLRPDASTQTTVSGTKDITACFNRALKARHASAARGAVKSDSLIGSPSPGSMLHLSVAQGNRRIWNKPHVDIATMAWCCTYLANSHEGELTLGDRPTRL